MRKTGLEFAPGTTEDCKKVVGRMFRPADLLGAYRAAQGKFGSNDIVLIATDQAPGIAYMRRVEYAREHLSKVFGARASEFAMWHKSAQSVVNMPIDSDAMWLIVELQNADLPLICVIFAVPYEISEASATQ